MSMLLLGRDTGEDATSGLGGCRGVEVSKERCNGDAVLDALWMYEVRLVGVGDVSSCRGGNGDAVLDTLWMYEVLC